MSVRRWTGLTVVLSTLLVAVLGVVLGAGCGPEFDPYWKINKFRVLAVKSSEPLLEPGEVAVLDALVYAPSGEEITYTWEWCPFRTNGGNAYECPFTREELEEALRQGGDLPEDFELPLVDFDLGTGPTAELPYPSSPVLLYGFCLQLQSYLSDAPEELASQIPVIDCERGFEATIRMVARSGDQEIVASKRIVIGLTDPEANLNPIIEAMQIRPRDAGAYEMLRSAGLDWIPDAELDDEERWYTLPPDAPTPVLPGFAYELRSLVAPESVEDWEPPAPQGDDVERLPPESEVILYRWLATGGGLDESRRLYVEDRNTLDVASITTLVLGGQEIAGDFDGDGLADDEDDCPYLPPEEAQGCTVKVWSIVRDGRLGLDWAERSLELVEPQGVVL